MHRQCSPHSPEYPASPYAACGNALFPVLSSLKGASPAIPLLSFFLNSPIFPSLSPPPALHVHTAPTVQIPQTSGSDENYRAAAVRQTRFPKADTPAICVHLHSKPPAFHAGGAAVAWGLLSVYLYPHPIRLQILGFLGLSQFLPYIPHMHHDSILITPSHSISAHRFRPRKRPCPDLDKDCRS